MRSFLSITGVTVVLTYVLALVVQSRHMADDPGLGWHLKTGELIAQSEEVLRIDPFLAAAVGANQYGAPLQPREWICDQWLSDLIFRNLFALGGWPLLCSSVVGLFVVALWGCGVASAQRRGAGALASTVAGLLAFKVAQVHLIVRPVVFSIVLFAVVIRIIQLLQARRVCSSGFYARTAGGVFVLFMLWANLHPAFVLGLMLLVLWLLSTLPLFGGGGSAWKLPTLLLLAGSVGSVINPYGLRLHQSIFELGASSYFMKLNSEWHPLVKSSFEGQLLLSLMAVSVVGLVWTWRKGHRVQVFDALSGVVFCALALRSVRFAPFAALAILPCASAALGAFRSIVVPRSARLVWNVVGRVRCFEDSRQPHVLLLSGMLASFGVALSVVVPATIPFRELGPSPDAYPVGALESLSVSGQSGALLASPNWGGQIALKLWPRFKAVLDDRNVLVGEALYRAYFASLEDGKAFDSLARVFNVRAAIFSTQAPVLNQLLVNPQWKILYRDNNNVVLLRD